MWKFGNMEIGEVVIFLARRLANRIEPLLAIGDE